MSVPAWLSPARCLPIVFAVALPAAASGGSLFMLGFNSVWEMWVVAAIFIAAALGCFRGAHRHYQGFLALPAWALLAAAGCLLFVSLFHVGSAFPERERKPKLLHVKRVVGGWSVWTDTAHAGGDKWVLASILGADSGSVFLLETHKHKVREFPRSFLCFNLYDSPEPQRYSDTAGKAVGLEIHRFNAWTREGFPRTDIHYDFTVKRRQGTWSIRGHLDGIDIGGVFEAEGAGSRGFFPPANPYPPEDYW